MKARISLMRAEADVPRCLTPEQRLVHYLPAEPPHLVPKYERVAY